MMSLQKTLVLCVALLAVGDASVAEDFSEFRAQMDDGVDAFEEDTLGEIQQEKVAFESYRQELLNAFSHYRSEAAMVWGEKNTVVPEKSNWVEYNSNRTARSVVDFEQGTVTVELALEAGEAGDGKDIAARLKWNIIKTLLLPPDTRSIIEIANKPGRTLYQKGTYVEPVLAGQVQGEGGQVLQVDRITAFADEQASRNVRTRTVKGEDGKSRVVVSSEFPLVPDHIRKRASKYQDYVDDYASKYRLPEEVVYAVIETESFFNPTARSHVPAFGLMQLVPTTGARDAYRYVYKRDRLLTDTYLYNPKNNIELGTAYLHRLANDYLGEIDSEQSRLWCAVAGYNTGYRNVLRAFVGKYNKAEYASYAAYKAKAFAEINRLSTEEVYEKLHNSLPYAETRSYIKKVRERAPKYRSL